MRFDSWNVMIATVCSNFGNLVALLLVSVYYYCRSGRNIGLVTPIDSM
jgi:hypothetical protein